LLRGRNSFRGCSKIGILLTCGSPHQTIEKAESGVAGVEELSPSALAGELSAAIVQARSDAREDPFGNPVLRATLWLTRRMDRGEVTLADTAALIRQLGRAALADRAARVASYVGLERDEAEAYAALARRVAEEASASAQPFEAYGAALARVRFAAVFTAHPTFGMSRAVAHALAELASNEGEAAALMAADLSFRPDAGITLQDEFEQARFAVRNARDAIDRLNVAFLAEARARWPQRWRELKPRALLLASWVGCDTDGRTDIGWWDTLRYRLESKRGQFFRLLEKLPGAPATVEVRALVEAAHAAVERQLALCPPLNSKPEIAALQAFSLSLVGEREAALPESSKLVAALDKAIVLAEDEATAEALVLARAGVIAHGVSIALPHFRLNASQLHNAMRGVISLDEEPAQPAQRRAFLAAVNQALARVKPTPVDFGALAVERASAARMMMMVAQIVKHVDGSRPVRFLIAETETGYTLLSALYLARRFGIADLVEISPLFETSDALEQGPRIIDEALRSPHWRDYLKRHGRLCVQFGYSDSGRYIGQVAATFWVERLRSRILELLQRYGLTEIELVIFDTHGESAGRGAHPDSLSDRLAYLDPEWPRRAFAKAGVKVTRETSFQGSDGYLLFGTQGLAGATVARIGEAVFADAAAGADDPIYAEPDFATEFFQTVREEMTHLVDDPGYAALIGTFGPSLLDKTGSRPAARQSDAGGPAVIRHPRELRAIPNNAILQQLLAGEQRAWHRPGGGAGAGAVFEHARKLRTLWPGLPPRGPCDGEQRSRRAACLSRYARCRLLVRPGAQDREGGAARRIACRRRGAGAARSRPRAAAAVLALRLRSVEAEGGGGRAAGDAGPAGGAPHATACAAAPHLAPGDPYPGFPAACRGDARAAAGAYPAARHGRGAGLARRDLPAQSRSGAGARFRRATGAARGRRLCRPTPRRGRADAGVLFAAARDLGRDPA